MTPYFLISLHVWNFFVTDDTSIKTKNESNQIKISLKFVKSLRVKKMKETETKKKKRKKMGRRKGVETRRKIIWRRMLDRSGSASDAGDSGCWIASAAINSAA